MSTIPFRKGRYKYTDDTQMVADVIAGNEDALGYLLYSRFKVAFETIFKNMVGRRKEFCKTHDDLVQDLYLKLKEDDWKTLRAYNASKGVRFSFWFISKVCHNFFLDQVKDVDSYKKNAIPMSDFDDQSRIYDIMTTRLGNDDESAYKSLMTVSEPPYRDFERDKKIFEAIEMHNEKKTDVAKLFNISERTVERGCRKIEAFIRLKLKFEKDPSLEKIEELIKPKSKIEKD